MSTPTKQTPVKVLDKIEIAAIIPIHQRRQALAIKFKEVQEQLMLAEAEFHRVMAVIHRPWAGTDGKYAYSFDDHTIYENVADVDINGVKPSAEQKPELKVEK